jgi:hypothetical protein
MTFDVAWTDSPYPAWSGIEDSMSDDSGFVVPGGLFLGVFSGDEMAACFTVIPWSEYCYQIHGGVSKDFWGRGVEICTSMGMFLFTTSPCVKIVAILPEYNRLMCRCLKKTGLSEEGRLKKSFVKNMKFHDQIIYGIHRSEVIKCQQRQR